MEIAPTTPAKGMVSFPQAVMLALRKYSDFSGRASRAEYWWWVLALWIGNSMVSALDATILSVSEQGTFSPSAPYSFWRSFCPPWPLPPAASTTSAAPAGGKWPGKPCSPWLDPLAYRRHRGPDWRYRRADWRDSRPDFHLGLRGVFRQSAGRPDWAGAGGLCNYRPALSGYLYLVDRLDDQAGNGRPQPLWAGSSGLDRAAPE